nr:hypothetical protein [Saccharopolyspora soli]
MGQQDVAQVFGDLAVRVVLRADHAVATGLLVRVVGLELFSGGGDEDDEELGWFCVAGVFCGHVVGTWLLDPVLALVVCTHRFAFELAAYSAFEHVGVDERVAVSVGHRSGVRGEGHGRRGEGFPWMFGSACWIRSVRVSEGCSEATAGVVGRSVAGAHPTTAAAVLAISTPLAIRTLIMTVALLFRPRPE